MSPKQTFHQIHSHPTPSLLVLFLLRMGGGARRELLQNDTKARLYSQAQSPAGTGGSVKAL